MTVINKDNLARKLAGKTLLPKKEAIMVIEELSDIIISEVKDGNDVAIVGFGKFYPYMHKERPVRNPKTQKSMILKPYVSLKFKASEKVKRILKKGSQTDNG